VGGRNAIIPPAKQYLPVSSNFNETLRLQKKIINTFFEFLELVDKSKTATADLLLFRGQSEKKPLVPSIARKDSQVDTTDTEKKMLEELKRRTKTLIDGMQFDEWDWLIYAQHFGMKTRLLDWTSNPLTALWFACSNEFKKTLIQLFIF